MAIDHTNCNHPRTPAGRRGCRASKTTAPTIGQPYVEWPEGMSERDYRALVRDRGNDYIQDHIRKTSANAAMKARMDRRYDDTPGVPYIPVPVDYPGTDAEYRSRKMATKPSRIQPRRSGARVAATSSTCVQAALHVDAHGGRCACGWEAVA